MFIIASDKQLFKWMMSLRKLDLFDLDKLADGEKGLTRAQFLRRLQNVGRYCGFNWWTEAPANIMAAAWRIKYEFGGVLPRDPEVLLSFYGVARKVCMLILQDCFRGEKRHRGIVMDRHVEAAVKNLGWSRIVNLEDLAQAIEAWLHPKFYRMLNEGAAGLRQLWSNDKNHKVMEKAASDLGCQALLNVVVMDCPSNNKNEIHLVDPLVLPGLKGFYTV